jgi:hypothetical protein
MGVISTGVARDAQADIKTFDNQRDDDGRLRPESVVDGRWPKTGSFCDGLHGRLGEPDAVEELPGRLEDAKLGRPPTSGGGSDTPLLALESISPYRRRSPQLE